jgi:DNA polymerase III epsilon subunit-like protein
MDCEMVGYGRKGSLSMLARCSLVTLSYENSKDDDDSSAATPKIKVLYDVYVKPTKNVTDYRTQYSGIIPEHLESADAVNWEVCQSQVKRILKSNSEKTVILVGHALKNDFEVLRYWVSGSLFKFTLHINSMQ